MALELPAGYYLDNFNYLLNFVSQHYNHLLNKDDQRFVARFSGLSPDAMRLYVRLLGRKGPLFRIDKLHYDDISDLSLAVTELAEAQLLLFSPLVEAKHYLSLLVKSELGQLFSITVNGHKRSVLEQLILDRWEAAEISQLLPFQVVMLDASLSVQRFRLLFFGNLHQDLSDFVLRDLGINRYETYPFDASYNAFNSSAQLDAVLAEYQLADHCHDVLDASDMNLLVAYCQTYLVCEAEQDALELHRDNELWLRRRNKTINVAARQLERYQQNDLAIALYAHAESVPARERTARILLARENPVAALDVCQQIIDDPWEQAEHEFAQQFGQRIAKKYVLPCDWLQTNLATKVDIELLELNPQVGVNVEMLVVADYRARFGTDHIYYVENSLFNGLFGLIFWDIIFAPIKGAFFNPFQRSPADLFRYEFRQRRQQQINERLDALLNGVDDLASTVVSRFNDKQGISNHFVNWRYLDEPLLRLAIERIPRADLVVVFERMLLDLKNNCSGFPDLIYFPLEGGFELIEVKGPGDQLQKNQKRWFSEFKQNDIKHKLTKVQFNAA